MNPYIKESYMEGLKGINNAIYVCSISMSVIRIYIYMATLVIIHIATV